MMLVIHLLVHYKVSLKYTLTHMLVVRTQHLLLPLMVSTMLLVIRVHLLMMLVCSTAHTFHYRWFVQLERTHSNQKSGLRLVMESFRIHLLKVHLLVWEQSDVTLTYTTEELRFKTLCKKKGNISFFTKTPLQGSFFML